MPTPTLATGAELTGIARKALAMLDTLAEREPSFTGRQAMLEVQQRRAAIEALRFVAAAAPLAGDGSVLPALVEALEICAPYDERPTDDVEAIAVGVTELLRAGATVDEGVRGLSVNENARVREAVAAGLRPNDARSVALLEKLVADPVPEVRRAARGTLAAVREVPWWCGKFASDPFARLSPSQATRFRPVLERISVLLDEPVHRWDSRQSELAELAEPLPDPLVVELAMSVLASHPPWGREPAMGTLMLRREGGLEGFARLIVSWAGHTESFYRMELAKRVVASLEDHERLRVCATLLQHALRAPASERVEFLGAPSLMAQAAAQGWPDDRLHEILDLLAQDRAPEDDRVTTELHARIGGGERPSAPLVARAIEARRGGYARMDRGLARALDRVLEHAPVRVLRTLAEQAIRRDDDGEVEWGLTLLLGPAYDPERDPPGTDLVAQLFAKPRFRRVFTRSDDLAAFALPLLRQELRAGRLRFADAHQTIRCIGDLYGGVANQGGWLADEEEEGEDDTRGRRKRRQLLGPYLGPKRLQGPPSAREWEQYRTARLEHGAGGRVDWRSALEVLPSGVWEASDRALFEAARVAFRGGDDDAGVGVAYALMAKPSKEDLPIFDELFARPSPATGLFQIARRRVRELLRLPEGDEDDVAPAAPVLREWMDEPEDEP